MSKTLRAAAFAASLSLALSPAFADFQTVNVPGVTPIGQFVNQALTSATNVTVALPSNGGSVSFYNTGGAPVNAVLGVSGIAATATTGEVIPAGGGCAFNLDKGKPAGFVGLYAVGGASNIQISGASGLTSGCWGGGSSGGSSSGGSLGQATGQTPINVSSAATTLLFAGVTGQYSYITSYDVQVAGQNTAALEYGTGGTCTTPTIIHPGVFATAGGGIAKSATGSVYTVPQSASVCLATSTSANVFGSISYTQSPTLLPGAGGGGGGGGGTFTWPGTATADVGAATTAGTMPFVNAYLPDISNHTLTVVQPAVGNFGSQTPASGAAMGATGAGGSLASVVQAGGSVPINISTQTSTLLVPFVTAAATRITAWDVLAGGTGTFQLEYGTQIQAFSASTATNVLTITASPNGSDGLFVGEVIAGTGITTGTTIVALLSGTANAIGATYSLSTTPGTLTARGMTAAGANPCNVGTTALTGAYPLVAQAGIAKGNGLGVVLPVPLNTSVCAVTSAAVQMSGSLSFSQF